MQHNKQENFAHVAMSKVEAFICRHPEYTLDGIDQPSQGFTNYVVFACRGGDLVVFKVFRQEERKARELFALRHWKNTGHVPDLILDVDATTIIMAHVPGVFLGNESVTEEVLLVSCFESGKAFGDLSLTLWSPIDQEAFSAPVYGDQSGLLEEKLEKVYTRSLDFQNPKFDDHFWQDSLDFVGSQLGTILSQPRFLCHQDATNFHVASGAFRGFFDLEMCRVGNEALQLGCALNAWGEFFSYGERRWPSFLDGWEAATQRKLSSGDLKALVAAHHWGCWAQITGYRQPPDPKKYRKRMEFITELLLGDSVLKA